MNKIVSWQGVCLDCGHRIYPDTQEIVEAEATLHKMKTGHRLLLHGEVKDVTECECKAAGLQKDGGDLMTEDRIKVIWLGAGNPPKVKEIDNTLEALQEQVGGHVQAVSLKLEGRQYVILVDEEGKLKGKPANLIWRGDVLVGDVLVTKDDGQGNFMSLDNDDIEVILFWWGLKRVKLTG